MKTLLAGSLAVAVSSATFADVTYVDVTTSTKLCVYATNTVLRPAATDGGTDPATLEAPSFWFDAGATNGWTVAADGDIARVPSKAGSRTLTAGDVAPKYVAADATTGLPCVDFGATGSGRALTFDGGSLANIGTVIMVRDTSAGGGAIFTGTAAAPDTWKRGANKSSSAADDPRYALAASDADDLVKTARVCQDALPYVATDIGWAGHWQTFSFNPASAATLTAAGLGAGGFKVAEMLVYDRLLTTDEIAGIETFLKNKWLGNVQPRAGADARADLLYANHTAAGGLTVGIDVGAGRQFLVKDIRAGHDGSVDGNAKIVKTGDGSLILGDFSRYNGTVQVEGGDVAFDYGEKPAYPSNIAARALWHIDPSAAASRTDVVEGGKTYVMRLDDVDGHTSPAGALLNVRSKGVETHEDGGVEYQADRRIYLCTDYAVPTGLPLLDFGPVGGWGHYWTHQLNFYAGDTENQVSKLTTVIAVVGAQRGGGWLMRGAFKRAGSDYTADYKTGLIDSTVSLSTAPALTPADGVVYVDGRKVDDPATTGYPDDGFHIIAYQSAGSWPEKIGGYFDQRGGGLILGELLAYASPLSEREILETQEYLARKWLGKTLFDSLDETLPRGDGVADVQNLTVDAASSITVSGATARIGTLTLNAPIVKKGAGTLYVEKLVNADNHAITFEGGDIRTIKKPELTAAGFAAAPSFHIDMTDTNGWTLATDKGANIVTRIPAGGSAGVILKSDINARAPWIDTGLGPKAGVPVLNFGEFYAQGGWTTDASARCLIFDRNLESVRSVFEVWRLPEGSSAMVMGSSGSNGINGDCYDGSKYLNSYRMDYHPGGGNNYTNGEYLSGWSATTGNAAQAARGGSIWENGVKCASTWQGKRKYEEWYLLESHALAGCHASSLASDRGTSMKRGGQALAEVLIYERELTEREKIATRDYLMKKWLGKSAPQEIPDPDPAQELSYEKVDVAAGVPVSMGVDDNNPIAIEHLNGAGSFTKTGDGTLTVGFTKDYDGALTVAGGTLKIKNAYRGGQAMAGVDKGLRFRLSADEITADMLEANTNGTIGVKTWPNSLGDGWKAEAQERGLPFTKDPYKRKLSDYIPVYDANSLNGKPTVNMHEGSCFQFKDPTGTFASVTGLRTVLWVIGSQEGGGIVLGGGRLDSTSEKERCYTWHRGGSAPGQKKEDPIICGSGFDAACYNCNWWLNSVWTRAEDGLSGSWDVLTWRSDLGDGKTYASTSGLAFDGRVFENQAYPTRVGHQRLAEILIYTNKLADTDMRATERYLSVKWGLNHTLASPDQTVDLWVAADAAVELDGYNLFRSVGGSGSVTGDFGATTFVADADETGLAVTGTLTVPAAPVIALANLPKAKVEITVAEATTYVGAENLANATFTGLPARWKGKAQLKDGKIVVTAKPRKGLLIRIN